MGRTLVVVESAAKSRTIQQYLGSGYLVRACFGHVRDLPVDRMGVDLILPLVDPPALWDCGASSTVYGTLRRDELMTFEAGGLPSRSGIRPRLCVRSVGVSNPGTNPILSSAPGDGSGVSDRVF